MVLKRDEKGRMYRIFNGKKYFYQNSYQDKGNALKQIKDLKADGFSFKYRIVKVKLASDRYPSYEVYKINR